MQMLEYRSGQHFQLMGIELVLQLSRIRGEISVRPKLDPAVAGGDHLAQELVGRQLRGVAVGTTRPRSPERCRW